MTFSSVVTIENIVLAGYVFSGSLLNIVALFISSFYQHRLNQSSPQAGFLVAVVFSFMYIALLFSGLGASITGKVVCFFLLLGYAISSSFSIVNLYTVMRSIRK